MYIHAKNQNKPQDALLDYPGIEDGVRGMKFIEAIVANSAGNEKYTEL